MSRARRDRRKRQQAVAAERKRREKFTPAPGVAQSPVDRAPLWLAAAFLLPNLGALACGFVFDDRALIVENQSIHIHSIRELAHIWKSGYWPEPHGLELYRPVTEILWALIWAAGGGSHPALFHAAGLMLGLAVVLLVYHFLLTVETPPQTAFIAAMFFALFPIHTDATTSVVGSAEMLAAAFGLGALICYYRRHPSFALIVFALAVFSKESAAAFAALPLAFPRKDIKSRDSAYVSIGAAMIIVAALIVHHSLARASQIPALDNPAALLSSSQRILTALWVQCLYLSKTILPITLSADYSYKQIPLVMGFDDWRAWAGLALLGCGALLAWRRREFRPAILTHAILFSPAANLLFPIGTIMGERLAYAPSLGVALLLAILVVRSHHWKIILIAVAFVFGARTAVRNLDWISSEKFYTRLAETSPNDAKSHYSLGVLRASAGDDARAIESYDRAIAIYPAYSEAYRNRGNSLARLGRDAEAIASYRLCLRLDPADATASFNLSQLEAGIHIDPPRAKF